MTTTKNTNLTANKAAESLPSYSFDFENKELARLTITIAQAEALGARAKLVVCYAMREIKDMGDEEMVRNGFKNFADYARAMFGYSKSNAYDMAAIADKFNVDEDGNIQSIPELRGMGWTGLLALKNVDDDKIRALVDSNELTPSTSVRAVKALIAPKRARKAKTEGAKETKTEGAKTEGAKTEGAKVKGRAKSFEVVPFTVTVRDGVVTFMQDGSDDVTTFDANNSTSAALAITKFKSLLGF